MPADRYKYFRVEARELVDELSRGLLALERQPLPADLVPRLFRCAHTLKGAAAVVKLPELAHRCHLFEDALTPLREQAAPPSRQQVDALLAHLDDLQSRLALLDAPPGPEPSAAAPPEAPPLPPPEPPPAPPKRAGADVDAVLESLAEVGLEVGALGGAVDRLRRTAELGALLARQLTALPGEGAGTARALAQALGGELSALQSQLSSGVDRLDRELGQARQDAEALRLVPVSTLFAALERSARDAALASGRRVELRCHGGDVRVDGPVLARMQPALVQLVRNAVAHGIEPASDRERAGKAPAGTVTVEVEHRGGRAIFRCSDDGRGVDFAAVRQEAARRGLLPQREAPYTSDELMRLLLRGGVSTAGDVTPIAGRGVGLDVVRDAVTRLAGEVNVHTVPGEGTALSLSVPVSLASLPALLVEAGDAVLAIPLAAVKGTTRLGPDDLARAAPGTALRYGDALLPFASATSAVPTLGAGASSAPRCAVVVASGARWVALGVERVVGIGQVLLRTLPALAPADPVVGAAWLDNQGRPGMVLDPAALVAAVQAGVAAPAAPAPRPRLPVLVIDDSLTTRMLEQSILESAGYEVEVATSAEEGLAKARARPFALFLVDVEMPGMDGFTFVESIRADAALSKVPAVLVTSRNAPEDRRRGEAAGANGYVVKSEFEQHRLLAMVRTLTGEA